jgi:hypothetical protein
MTAPADFIQPPRTAIWLVDLFAQTEEAESILGDLLEEFSQLASKSGVAFARRWYWRQTAKTVAHLFGAGFRGAPWSVTALVIGGFLLLRLAHGLPDKVLMAVTDRYLNYWSTHFQAYAWLLKGLWIEYLTGSAVVGYIVALAARRREMVATMTLGLILCAMVVVGEVWVVAATGHGSYLWNLPWHLSDPLAIVIGGAIVRTRRLGATHRHSGA